MQSVTINFSNEQELERLLLVVKELGLQWKKNGVAKDPEKPLTPAERRRRLIESSPKISDEELAQNIKIIEAGGEMSDERLQEWLDYIQESRKEHPNPLRP